MKKTVKFLPVTAAATVTAVAVVMTTTTTTTNNNAFVDAFSIHPTFTHRPSTTTTTTTTPPKSSRSMMTVTTTMKGHGSFCTCYVCTSTGGSYKLSANGDHPSSCHCPACCSSSSIVGAIEQQPILQKRQGAEISHGSLCDCGFCRQQQQKHQQQRGHRHGPGCSCSQCS